jgi:thioredoxin reductase
MTPLSVAVIGAGPSGLFFCHAIECMMKKTGKEVSVTCFEKSSQPGGIWRSAESINANNADADTTLMYDKLWTNGSSHLTEFFDYTFDEHFGRPVSVYMKRQDLLDYILGRVQKNCPNFFEKYVQFYRLVENVVFNDTDQQFHITVKHLDDTQESAVHRFDKCIWACGENGRRYIPENLVRLFRDGGFKGRIIHSSDTARLEDDVKDKQILLIGGGLSAEDIALQAIKLKAKKVYVGTRVFSEVCWTSHWPMDKVSVLVNQTPVSVTENGNCIQFMEVEWEPDGYVRDGDHIESEIRDIDTVILCTGYRANIEMLDLSLHQGFPQGKLYHDEYLSVPNDWKMSPNFLTKYVGDVPVADRVYYYTCYIHPKLYRGVLISNPNIMFISSYEAEVPLMACDVNAWLFAGYMTGCIKLPTADEMYERNVRQGLEYLDIPYFRYLMDRNYFEAVNSIEGIFPDDPMESSPLWDEIEKAEACQAIKVLTRTMQEAMYPFSLGTYEKFNENGESTMEFLKQEYDHRAKIDPVGDEKNWKTYRDYDDAEKFYSLFTGTKAVKLDKPWLEM